MNAEAEAIELYGNPESKYREAIAAARDELQSLVEEEVEIKGAILRNSRRIGRLRLAMDSLETLLAGKQHRHTAACGGIPGSIEHGIGCGIVVEE